MASLEPLVCGEPEAAALEHALEAALVAGLSRVRALGTAFQDALGHPGWPLAPVPQFFPWKEFVNATALFGGAPRRTLAAVFLREEHGGRPLVATLRFDGEPRLARLRSGKAVEQLSAELSPLRDEPEGVHLAVAMEAQHGTLGWLLSEASGRRRFRPIFPGRYGLHSRESCSDPRALRFPE